MKFDQQSEAARILLVEDDRQYRRLIRDALADEFEVIETGSLAGSKAAAKDAFDIVILDLCIPENRKAKIIPAIESGMKFLQYMKVHQPEVPVFVLTGYGEVPMVVNAMKSGAEDYIIKSGSPEDIEALLQKCRNAFEKVRLFRENQRVKARVSHLMSPLKERFYIVPGDPPMCKAIIGNSLVMSQLLNDVKSIAERTESDTVLITGESGTGKELVSQAIHFNSSRAENQLVMVNVASITDELLESELFGHEKGAFTGATGNRVGLFEAADQSTIFLDEIGDLSPKGQISLLRVLEDKKIRRVGSSVFTSVNVRVITATNKNLAELSREGKFRVDLFQRLTRFLIDIPPLRDRKEDIPLLVNWFLQKAANNSGMPIIEIEPDALDLICEYDWMAGNVRELENVIDPLAKLARVEVITLEEVSRELKKRRMYSQDTAPLASKIQSSSKVNYSAHPLPELRLSPENIKELLKNPFLSDMHEEKLALVRAFINTQGNVSKLAEQLGLNRREQLQSTIENVVIEILARGILSTEANISELAEKWQVNQTALKKTLVWNNRVGNWLQKRYKMYDSLEDAAAYFQVRPEQFMQVINFLSQG